jgi:hypothetical protein
MDQQVYIKCFVKLDKTPTETYRILQTVYGDEALSRSSVFEWFKRFKDGHEDLQDEPRSGSLSGSRNADIIANRDTRYSIYSHNDIGRTKQQYKDDSSNPP